MSVYQKRYTGRDGSTCRTRVWYAEVRDHLDRVQVVSGYRDKRATQELERRLRMLVALRATGAAADAAMRRWIESLGPKLLARLTRADLLDAGVLMTLQSLEQHLAAWTEYLRKRGRTAGHVGLVTSRARKVLQGTGAVFWRDIRSHRVAEFLLDLREQGGVSNRTSNAYLQATRQFCRWCVRNGLGAGDPLGDLDPLDAERDRRLERRALSAVELQALIHATHTGPERAGMPGTERALVYVLAVETGLRRNELVQLRVADCDVGDPGSASLRLRAENTKNRRADQLPLRADAAKWLADHVAGRAPTERVFSMPTWWRSAETLRADLAAAQVPYCDAAGRVVDFHALRTTFATNLARAGLPLQIAQKLMRHSTPVLTANAYTVLNRDDERRAVESLPVIRPRGALVELRRGGTG